MTRRLGLFLLVLPAVVASGCGGRSTADLDDALTVGLPGFVTAAERPLPETLCDPSPSGGEPPGLPPEFGDLGAPAAAFYERAESTVEAYAWAADDAAGVVDAATRAAADCTHEIFFDSDTDGDGQLDAGGTDVQEVASWEGSGWTGVRIHREVGGTGSAEQVERRLVRTDDVVLLVVLRSDLLGEEQSAPLDSLLEQVHDSLQ